MLWSQEGYDGEIGAEWIVFKRKDKDAVRRFLKTRFQDSIGKDIDPILSQQFYFNSKLLEELEVAENVRPYRRKQQMGEAILIPAGCAHQVKTTQAYCLKINILIFIAGQESWALYKTGR